MKVKRYVASSMPEAMQRIKAELGLDAVILHTREFRQGGIFGLFGKKMVEVTAAIEETSPPKAAGKTLPASEPMPIATGPAGGPGQALDDRLNSLHSEMKETKALMRQMLDAVEPIQALDPNLPPNAKRLWKRLVDNEVDPDLAMELLNSALAGPAGARTEDAPEPGDLEQYVQAEILTLMQKAQIAPPIDGKRPIIINLIGPTGVGKTTTIAKLAARSALIDRHRVGLVTIDTYRIAAVEQLKTYGKILGLPVEVVYTPEELRATLARMQDLDSIYIDTAGRSHHNATQMAELHAFHEAAQPDVTYLVLSTTTKYRDLIEIIVSYEVLHPQGLVFTKLDETESYGSIFNVVALLQKQLAYVTHGQNVPDDIREFDPSYLTELIMGNGAHARSS
ncbi:MAG: flagellar biosynthesis protein FlhF [Bacillota bacterium]